MARCASYATGLPICSHALRRSDTAEEAEQKSLDASRHAQEAELRAKDAMRRCRESEQSSFEAARLSREAEQARANADLKTHQATERAAEAERREAEIVGKLRDSEGEWRLQMDCKTRELELKTAEVELRRQEEIRAAFLELQAVSQSQQALRTQMLRVQPPPQLNFSATGSTLSSPAARRPVRLHSLQQPGEVWGRASETAPESYHPFASTLSPQATSLNSTTLFSGKVAEQAAFLDKQVRDLESRMLYAETSALPGFM